MIEVGYKCHACGAERNVAVEERAAGEDVRDWVQFAGVHVHRDHRLASPSCSSEHVDLKIPLSGTDPDFAPIGTMRKS